MILQHSMVMLNNDIVAVCCDVGSIMDHPLETTKSHDVLQDLKDQNTANAAPILPSVANVFHDSKINGWSLAYSSLEYVDRGGIS